LLLVLKEPSKRLMVTRPVQVYGVGHLREADLFITSLLLRFPRHACKGTSTNRPKDTRRTCLNLREKMPAAILLLVNFAQSSSTFEPVKAPRVMRRENTTFQLYLEVSEIEIGRY
jgi:hypothetical protein